MASVHLLSSPKNPLLRDIRRAVARGALTDAGCCVAETFHLLEEALRGDCRIEHVLAAGSVRSAVESRVRGLAGVKLLVLPDVLFQQVAATETSQGVMALVQAPSWKRPFAAIAGSNTFWPPSPSGVPWKAACAAWPA